MAHRLQIAVVRQIQAGIVEKLMGAFGEDWTKIEGHLLQEPLTGWEGEILNFQLLA